MKISNNMQYFGGVTPLRKRYDSLTPVVEFMLNAPFQRYCKFNFLLRTAPLFHPNFWVFPLN